MDYEPAWQVMYTRVKNRIDQLQENIEEQQDGWIENLRELRDRYVRAIAIILMDHEYMGSMTCTRMLKDIGVIPSGVIFPGEDKVEEPSLEDFDWEEGEE